MSAWSNLKIREASERRSGVAGSKYLTRNIYKRQPPMYVMLAKPKNVQSSILW